MGNNVIVKRIEDGVKADKPVVVGSARASQIIMNAFDGKCINDLFAILRRLPDQFGTTS